MDSTTGTIVNPYWFNEESFSGDGDFGHAPESMVSAKASINPNWLRPDTFSKSEVETPEEIDENPADSPSEADEDAVAHVFPEQHSMSVGKIGDAGDIVDWCEPNTLVQDIRRIREQQRLERGSAVRPDSKPRIIETTSTGGRRVVPQSEKKAPQRVDDKDRSTFDPAALRGNRIADKLRAKRYDEKWGWLGRDEN